MNSLYALISMGAMGLLFGLALGMAAKKFAVEKDPKADAILAVLPGANCGGCGYAGCSGLATAIAAGEAPVDRCPVGKSPVAMKIADIMGVKCEGGSEPKYAKVLCLGDCEKAQNVCEYHGIESCRSAMLSGGGPKGCMYGCLGLGDCASACPFDAIHIGEKGLPVVDEDLCTGCGKCVAACPRGIIELRTAKESVNVACKSHARGPEVRKVCQVGCIGCGMCVRNCPEQAITLDRNLAQIDQEKCIRCGVCIEKCPQKCIINFADSGLKVVGAPSGEADAGVRAGA